MKKTIEITVCDICERELVGNIAFSSYSHPKREDDILICQDCKTHFIRRVIQKSTLADLYEHFKETRNAIYD